MNRSRLQGFFIAVTCLIAAFAVDAQQTPEQRARENTLLQAQQQVEFARQARERAAADLKSIEQRAADARARERTAERELRDAQAAVERLGEEVVAARKRSSEARAAYEAESAKFQQLRSQQ